MTDAQITEHIAEKVLRRVRDRSLMRLDGYDLLNGGGIVVVEATHPEFKTRCLFLLTYIADAMDALEKWRKNMNPGDEINGITVSCDDSGWCVETVNGGYSDWVGEWITYADLPRGICTALVAATKEGKT